MKLFDYIKSRMAAYVIFLCAGVFVLVFMMAFKCEMSLILAAFAILFAMFFAAESFEFFRRKKFFDRINSQLDSLDKKYLIREMIEEPDFIEGKLLCEIIHETDSSMCENVAEYRRITEDFREFIELWVHEIKLPVSALLLMCSNKSFGEKAYEQLRRIDLYTDQVLYYARSENAEKDYMISEVSLKKIVSASALRFKDDLLMHDVLLMSDCGNLTVHSDGKWLEYILGQLISNSLKYFDSSREAQINISAEEHSDCTVMLFRDNGIGISENDIPLIFEKSFTGENGRDHAKSTGIGLYIVKTLCEKLGHKIEVDSKKGEFTEFRITFAKNHFYEF